MSRQNKPFRFWAGILCVFASFILIGATSYLLLRPFPESWGRYDRPLVILVGGFGLGFCLAVAALPLLFTDALRDLDAEGRQKTAQTMLPGFRTIPMTTAPKRRWFAFSLRTLFVGVAVFGIWLGWEFNFVHQRNAMRDWIADHGGSVDVFVRPDVSGSLAIIQYERVLGPEEEPSIPQWRRWLGDEAINHVMMPAGTTDADLERARSLFPEGNVKRIESRPGRGLLWPPSLSPPAETSVAGPFPRIMHKGRIKVASGGV
jgi:hypothetical protein